MATISNPTDPNRAVQTTSNVAPQVMQPNQQQPQAASTGQFSTLQKYLGANQGSGQRLASAIGGNLNNEAGSLQDVSQRTLDTSANANKNITNLTGQTSDFTNQLKTPSTVAAVNPTAKAYDVNSYSTNLSGQQAAQDIANNQDKLNTFRGIASGDTSSKLRDESTTQANEALKSTANAYDTNAKRQSQLNNFGDRSQLLQQAVNTKNQRAGIQNLDNALLSQDKSGTLNQINQNLQNQVGNLQQYKNTANSQFKDVGTLSDAQTSAEKGLTGRVADMNKEQQSTLDSRVSSINAAKDARKEYLTNAYNKFRDTGEINQDLYDIMQLNNVQDVDKAAGIGGGTVVAQKLQNNETPQQKKVRLFNILKDSNLNKFLDTNLLDTKAASGRDVANQQDITALNALAALSGNTNDIGLSKFQGRQLGESSLDEALNNRSQEFLDKDLAERYYGHGADTQNMGGGKKGYGASDATASLNDYIYGQGIARNSRNSVGGGIGSLLNSVVSLPNNLMTGNIGATTNNLTDTFSGLTDIVSDPVNSATVIGSALLGPTGTYLGAGLTTENANRNRVNGELAARDAGYSFNGGKNANNYGQMDNWAAQTQAEQQAVGQVNAQAQDKINQIGYNNLLRLMQNKGEEY